MAQAHHCAADWDSAETAPTRKSIVTVIAFNPSEDSPYKTIGCAILSVRYFISFCLYFSLHIS